MAHAPSDARSIASPTPRRITRPSWLDLRLIMGVGLVIVSVLVGATVVSRSDHRAPVWTLRHAVAAGTVLAPADVAVRRVQLGASAGGYLPASESVVGRTVRADLGAGELIPRAVLAVPTPGVTVSIPLTGDHAPRVSVGDRVIIWLSTKTCRGAVLLGGVPVQDLRTSGGGPLSGDPGIGLIVRITPSDADRLMSVLDLDGATLRVGVLSAGEAPAVPTDVSGCAGASA